MAVASLAQKPHAAVISLGNIGTRPCALAKLIRRLHAKSPPLGFVSAAGPGGSWLSRSLSNKGQGCWVVAPSCIPTKPGERVKTTRRAALTLARLRRSGDLPPVSVPTGEDEARRDLGRARADALHARTTAQGRLHAVLLRPAIPSTGRAPWGPAHRRWRRAVGCPPPAPQRVFHAYRRAGTEPTARLARLEQALTAQGRTGRLAPVVDALPALRGVPGTVAVSTGAQLGDLPRFDHPRPLMPSLGFTPAA